MTWVTSPRPTKPHRIVLLRGGGEDGLEEEAITEERLLLRKEIHVDHKITERLVNCSGKQSAGIKRQAARKRRKRLQSTSAIISASFFCCPRSRYFRLSPSLKMKGSHIAFSYSMEWYLDSSRGSPRRHMRNTLLLSRTS